MLNSNKPLSGLDIHNILYSQLNELHQNTTNIIHKQLVESMDKININKWYIIEKTNSNSTTNHLDQWVFFPFKQTGSSSIFYYIAKPYDVCKIPTLRQIGGTCWFYAVIHALRAISCDVEYITPLVLSLSDINHQSKELDEFQKQMIANKQIGKNLETFKNQLQEFFMKKSLYKNSEKYVAKIGGYYPEIYLMYFLTKCLVKYKYFYVDNTQEIHKVFDTNTDEQIIVLYCANLETIKSITNAYKNFYLKSGVIVYTVTDQSHAVAGVFCDGKQAIIDSNTSLHFINWFGNEVTEVWHVVENKKQIAYKIHHARAYIYIRQLDTCPTKTSIEIKDEDKAIIFSIIPKTDALESAISKHNILNVLFYQLHSFILKHNDVRLKDVQTCLYLISMKYPFKEQKQVFLNLLDNLPLHLKYLGDNILDDDKFGVFDLLRRIKIIIIHHIQKYQHTALKTCKNISLQPFTEDEFFCKVQDYAIFNSKHICVLHVGGVGSPAFFKTRQSIHGFHMKINTYSTMIEFHQFFDYRTRGFLDFKNAFQNASALKKFNNEWFKNHDRVNALVNQIIQLLKDDIYNLVLFGISHGALLINAALTHIRLYNDPTLLQNTFVYTIGSPRIIPKSIIPFQTITLPRVLNYYHEKDPVLKRLSILKQFGLFNFPQLGVKQKKIPFTYDESHATFVFSDSLKWTKSYKYDYHTSLSFISPTYPFKNDNEQPSNDFCYCGIFCYPGVLYKYGSNFEIIELTILAHHGQLYQSINDPAHFKFTKINSEDLKNILLFANNETSFISKNNFEIVREDMLFYNGLVFKEHRIHKSQLNTKNFQIVHLPDDLQFYIDIPIKIFNSCFIDLPSKVGIKQLILNSDILQLSSHLDILTFSIGGLFKVFVYSPNKKHQDLKTLLNNTKNYHLYRACKSGDWRFSHISFLVNDNDLFYVDFNEYLFDSQYFVTKDIVLKGLSSIQNNPEKCQVFSILKYYSLFRTADNDNLDLQDFPDLANLKTLLKSNMYKYDNQQTISLLNKDLNVEYILNMSTNNKQKTAYYQVYKISETTLSEQKTEWAVLFSTPKIL
jgi:hypothetical protein